MDGKEALEAADFAVGYEVFRQIIRHHLRSVPMDGLARALGVDTPVLWDFMQGAPLPLALFQNGKAAGLADGLRPVEVEAEAIGLNLIADTFPPGERPRVRRALADALLPVLRAEGRNPATLSDGRPQ